MATKKNVRGSAKLWDRVFESGPMSHEEVSKAIADTRQNYRLVRWWWYGQPAIDIVKMTLEVQVANAGQVFTDLINTHGQETQVSFDVFPYGVPKPDGLRVNVVLERNIARK